MNEKNSERRKAPRHSVHIEGRIITPEASTPIAVKEISVEGLRIESARTMGSGTNVAISLQLEEEVLLYGTVIWALDSGQKSHRAYQIGIETYAIVIPEIKAIAFPEKAELVDNILQRIPKKGTT